MINQDFENFLENANNHLFSFRDFNPFRNKREGFFQGLLIGSFLTLLMTIYGEASPEMSGKIVKLIVLATMAGGTIGAIRENYDELRQRFRL